ncbi:MAG: NADH-quinone oxidoreductase subunit M [Lutibacter sp.]|jgi:NADH-quinone oxidoreductase subunit M|uniref:complex I subunit 4 family protein n=1 Tax=Lutibacter sp. TaxID=1925666 RepID=UPI00182EBD39|nr:NADH-quinone oxidoreductase subunit M [Lutibacter sp.]MBT8316782.1 NADH-quinone oxidoreductase subunit M [Lutibacter sp.]NNJ57642.1 NADH-quinone oxidoreductase subunit M [Lutibacter sp.]
MDILSLFVVVPVLTILALVFTKGLKQARQVSMVGSIIQLGMAVNLVISYFKEKAINDNIMVFTKDLVWFEQFNIHYAIGVDGISVALIVLTTIVVLAGVFISWKMPDLPKEFFISLLVLSTGVYGFFISIDLFTMFVFYEIAVIPMYLLIGIWGSGPKEYSAMKLTLMLMGASAVLLVGVLGIYFNSNADGGALTFNILEISQVNIPFEAQKLFFPLTFIGFAVLGALFPFHTWSPDGHASAPTAVSMLHAGVLMKLGGYGVFRVAMFLLPEGAMHWDWFFIILAATGVVYGAFGAIKQTDLKYINAYASVSHLGLVLFALLTLNKTAWNGAIIQSLSHGLLTAMFFALIGMVYGRTHTRDINKLGGLMKIMPFIGAIYVITGMAYLGLPGFSGFVAEMNIFVGAFQNPDTFQRVLTILAVSSIVVTAVYILRLVGKIMMGPLVNDDFANLPKATWYEKTGILLLLIPIVAIGVVPLWLSDMIMASLDPFIKGVL